jgi:hypothetical protein
MMSTYKTQSGELVEAVAQGELVEKIGGYGPDSPIVKANLPKKGGYRTFIGSPLAKVQAWRDIVQPILKGRGFHPYKDFRVIGYSDNSIILHHLKSNKLAFVHKGDDELIDTEGLPFSVSGSHGYAKTGQKKAKAAAGGGAPAVFKTGDAKVDSAIKWIVSKAKPLGGGEYQFKGRLPQKMVDVVRKAALAGKLTDMDTVGKHSYSLKNPEGDELSFIHGTTVQGHRSVDVMIYTKAKKESAVPDYHSNLRSLVEAREDQRDPMTQFRALSGVRPTLPGLTEAEEGYKLVQKPGEDYWYVKVGGSTIGVISKHGSGYDADTEPDGKGKFRKGFKSPEDAASWVHQQMKSESIEGQLSDLHEGSLGRLLSALDIVIENAQRYGRPTTIGKGIKQITYDEAKWIVRKVPHANWVETRDKKNAVTVDPHADRMWKFRNSLEDQVYESFESEGQLLSEAWKFNLPRGAEKDAGKIAQAIMDSIPRGLQRVMARGEHGGVHRKGNGVYIGRDYYLAVKPSGSGDAWDIVLFHKGKAIGYAKGQSRPAEIARHIESYMRQALRPVLGEMESVESIEEAGGGTMAYKDLKKGDICYSPHHGFVKKVSDKAAKDHKGAKVLMKPANQVHPKGSPGFKEKAKGFAGRGLAKLKEALDEIASQALSEYYDPATSPHNKLLVDAARKSEVLLKRQLKGVKKISHRLHYHSGGGSAARYAVFDIRFDDGRTVELQLTVGSHEYGGEYVSTGDIYGDVEGYESDELQGTDDIRRELSNVRKLWAWVGDGSQLEESAE